MRITKDIYYSILRDDDHKIDLYLPDGECRAIFVYFHGGGFVEGSRDVECMPRFAENMTGAGIGIASAEYRMYPKAKYPDFIEDAAEAVAYAKRELLPLAGCERLIVGGSSAGGYLSMMLCFDERYLSTHGLSANDVDCFVHDAGQPTAHFNVLKERGIDPRRVIIDDTAPLFHVGVAESYPPMQIIVSDNDIENRLEQTELLLGAIKSFGYDMKKVRYTKAHSTHVGYLKRLNESGDNEFAELIMPFINSVI